MENVNTIQGQWAEICSQLAQNLGDRFAMRWLSKIVPDKIEDNRVNLTVPSPCIHELIQRNYVDQILSLWQAKNPQVSAINLQLNPKVETDSVNNKQKTNTPMLVTDSTPTSTIYHAPQECQSFDIESNTIDIPCYLDKEHTFDTFVVGKSNRFAYAAAQKIAEEDIPSFNPLYFHAGSGLGKTQLMHAIAWRIKQRHPEKSVLYLSCEQFCQRCVQDLRKSKDKDSFLTFARSVDVLLIDDIQFILGKPWTQETFFHTFNN